MNTGQGSDRLVPQVIFIFSQLFPSPADLQGGDAGLRHSRLHRRVQHGAFAHFTAPGEDTDMNFELTRIF